MSAELPSVRGGLRPLSAPVVSTHHHEVVVYGNAQQPDNKPDSREVTVYILDDHHEVRYQIVELVAGASGMTVVGSSHDPEIAFREISLLRPRVAVLDELNGVGDGLEICRQLAATQADVRCVLTTSGIGATWGLHEAAEAGAWAFLLKQLSDFPLVEVIGRVGAGERLLTGCSQ